MQAPFTEPKKMPISDKTPRRGTLDHEFLGDQNENTSEESNGKNEECVPSDQHELNKKDSSSLSKDHDQSTNNDSSADDDEKSHVSDLTEDRIQRGFDTKQQERITTIISH